MSFDIQEMRGSTVWNIYRLRHRIQLDPEYQRLSDVWTQEKRELLVDTILNDFDVPKLYFHKFKSPTKKGNKSYDYAIVDGKQRLETLWSFIEGRISIGQDFEYFKDTSVRASNMTYAELSKEHPDLKAQFDGFQLNVVLIETDELEMIEEMFSRLNEAAPLSAPEKRNAFGGPIPVAVRKLAKVQFFTKSLPFPNKRYRHYDLATKFLFAEYADKVSDTKKAYLDEFVRSFKRESRTKMPPALKAAEAVANRMFKVFTAKDALLRQVGIITLYYHLFRIAKGEGWVGDVTRKKLADFEKRRDDNRQKAEQDITKADYDLLEFDRYAQSPNDAVALKFRLKILLREVFGKHVNTDEL
jgi:hypothetical protein